LLSLDGAVAAAVLLVAVGLAVGMSVAADVVVDVVAVAVAADVDLVAAEGAGLQQPLAVVAAAVADVGPQNGFHKECRLFCVGLRAAAQETAAAAAARTTRSESFLSARACAANTSSLAQFLLQIQHTSIYIDIYKYIDIYNNTRQYI